MNIQDYFQRLNNDSQDVLARTMADKDSLGSLHHLSSCIYEFSGCIVDQQEKQILETVSAQLESATFNLILGLYRQAFSSLRLALEMGLAAIYFSTNKIELYEWLEGRMDIKWSKLVDENNGVLSNRFAMAFFREIAGDIEDYRNKAIFVYRTLSEYVHGNNETWSDSGIRLSYNKGLFDKYSDCYKTVCEVILFSATCRYVKFLDDSSIESISFLPEELNQITAVRNIFGQC